MSTKTYEGTVLNGSIHLPEDVRLPENARVLVTVSDDAGHGQARINTPRLAHPEQVRDFEMEVKGSPDARV